MKYSKGEISEATGYYQKNIGLTVLCYVMVPGPFWKKIISVANARAAKHVSDSTRCYVGSYLSDAYFRPSKAIKRQSP